MFSDFKSSFPQVTIFSLCQIPIPLYKDIENIVSLVDQILLLKKYNPIEDTFNLETEIDKLIYTLYGLTEEEIKIVEGV